MLLIRSAVMGRFGILTCGHVATFKPFGAENGADNHVEKTDYDKLTCAAHHRAARVIGAHTDAHKRVWKPWIAGVSHDIRTPLSLVMGYASQLEDDPGLSQDKREQAGIIRRQSERIKTLVSDLNLASKLEYDMQPLRKTDVLPAALLRSIAADFYNGGLDERYSIDVTICGDAQNVAITGDEELLRRAVSNLITNSIRHNPNGCAIKITLEKRSGSCIVSVSDNGTGFPQNVLESLKSEADTAELQSHESFQ